MFTSFKPASLENLITIVKAQTHETLRSGDEVKPSIEMATQLGIEKLLQPTQLIKRF